MTADEILQLAQSLNGRDEPYALVTVVRVAAPTSAYVGAQAIVRRDGTIEGWIGGGCAKEVVIEAARQAISSGEPRLVRITNDDHAPETGVEQHAMACASNGTIELFIQPYSPRISLCVLGDTPAAEDARFFAQRLGIRLVALPDEAPVVLIATQGNGDAEALERALAGAARHVLMIASRRKADKLREVMRMRGIDETRLARLQAPAGPDAGAKTPAEIALVAMTGVLALLRGRGVANDQPATHETRDAAGSAMDAPSMAGIGAVAETAATFINPVCGMAVSITTPKHVETFDGDDYYFCCDGCWETFKQNPAKYAAIRRVSMAKVSA
ncbi:MAG TPA: XdhC family protein [Casimicrobiaceae bacterium]|nr:XdhC family protein [Casimicrobiaceae bacterium]